MRINDGRIGDFQNLEFLQFDIFSTPNKAIFPILCIKRGQLRFHESYNIYHLSKVMW
jgi:hypothetical protein